MSKNQLGCIPEDSHLQHRVHNLYRMHYIISFASISSEVLLYVGILMSLFCRWLEFGHSYSLILSVTVCSAPILLIVLKNFYFDKTYDGVYKNIYIFYTGLMMAVSSLKVLCTENVLGVTQDVLNAFFVMHCISKCIVFILERFTGVATIGKSILPMNYVWFLCGCCLSFLFYSDEFYIYWLSLVTLAFYACALTMKSYWAFFNIFVVLFVIKHSYVTTPVLAVNEYAMAAIGIHVLAEPTLNCFFHPSSVFDRWTWFFRIRAFYRFISLFALFAIEISFFIIAVKSAVESTDQPFFTIPGLVILAILWVFLHFIFFITLWQVNSKLSDCIDEKQELGGGVLRKRMATLGMRHLCIISYRFVLAAAISTWLLIISLWWHAPALTYIQLIVPCELLILTLFGELSSQVGGTCVCYALLSPNSLHLKPGMPIPPSIVQEQNSRSGELLLRIQSFFHANILDTYACDYSTNALSSSHLNAKLSSFFSSRTPDGLPYDTYFLYYCGDTLSNGDWALADDATMSLPNILTAWNSKASPSSRLIIFVDSSSAYSWLSQVKKLKHDCVGLQTRRANGKADLESGSGSKCGRFTLSWLDFNNDSSDLQVVGVPVPSMAAYSVSSAWANYTFRLPTQQDVISHARLSFPFVTVPIIRLIFALASVRCGWLFCYPLCDLLRRWKLYYCPPKVLDTGHGFYLLSS